MGTRADFYIATVDNAAQSVIDAEWLGSVAMDGYPSGIGRGMSFASDAEDFRGRVARLLSERSDASTPGDGWPWPWENSRTTDYAYVWDGAEVRVFCFGYPSSWNENDDREEEGGKWAFPDMGKGNAAAGSKRSGVLVFTVKS